MPNLPDQGNPTLNGKGDPRADIVNLHNPTFTELSQPQPPPGKPRSRHLPHLHYPSNPTPRPKPHPANNHRRPHLISLAAYPVFPD